MGRVIAGDFGKLFQNRYIYLCMAGFAAVLVFSAAPQILATRFPGPFTDSLYSAIINEGMLAGYILCIAGGGFLYCSEEKYGFLYMEVLRVGAGKYTAGKTLVSMLGGFATAFGGAALAGLVDEILILAHTGEPFWPDALGLFNCFCQVFFYSLLCGVLSALAFVVTTILPNYYVGLAFPVLIYYLLVILNAHLPVPGMLKLENVYWTLFNANERYQYGSLFLYGLLYTLCLLVLFYLIAANRIKRRLEHA